jgi:hypothetical protein
LDKLNLAFNLSNKFYYYNVTIIQIYYYIIYLKNDVYLVTTFSSYDNFILLNKINYDKF